MTRTKLHPTVWGHWQHTHGDYRGYRCECGAEWEESEQHPIGHGCPNAGRTAHDLDIEEEQ